MVTIVARSPVERRATRIGFNQSALVASVTVGPALGGILGETSGLRESLVIVGAVSALGAVLTWGAWNWATGEPGATGHQRAGHDDGPATATAAEPATSTSGEASATGPDRILWSAFLTACAINLMVFATRNGARQTILPLIAVEEFSLSVGAMGALFTMMSVASLLVLPAASWAGDRFGRTQTIIPGLLAIAGGLAMCAVAGSLPVLWVGAAIMAAGMSLSGPAPMAWAADASPAPRHGVTLAVFRTVGDVGSFLGPVSLAWVAIATTLGASLLMNGAAILVLATMTLATGLRGRYRDRGPG